MFYENMQVFFDAIKYSEYQWNIFSDLKGDCNVDENVVRIYVEI